MPVLVQQRSEGRWRPAHTLSFARSRSGGERITVRFDRCGAIKIISRDRLAVFDDELEDMPYCYALVQQIAMRRTTEAHRQRLRDNFRYSVGDMCVAARRYEEKYWSFRKTAKLMDLPGPFRLSRKDHVSVLQHYSDYRRGRVTAFKQYKRNGELSKLQQRLTGTHTPASIRAVIEERRVEVMLTLPDDYLKSRVSALRRWRWTVISVFGAGDPWRATVWPGNQDPDLLVTEDEISLFFCVEGSMRFINGSTVASAFMHVKEFILGILGVECGPRPRTEHFLKRVSHALLAENPAGKTERPGYEPDEYDQMCGLLKDRRQAAKDNGDDVGASEYHELLMAMCAVYEPAARVGEFCPGSSWNPARGDWTKETLRSMITREGIAEGAVAVLLGQPHRKTEKNEEPHSTTTRTAAAGISSQRRLAQLLVVQRGSRESDFQSG